MGGIRSALKREGGQNALPTPGVRSVQINFQLFAIYHPFGAYTGSGVKISHRVILVKTRSGEGVRSALKRGGQERAQEGGQEHAPYLGGSERSD